MFIQNAAISQTSWANRFKLSAVFSRMFQMIELRRQRLALTGLTAEQLNDIGISRAEAEKEAAKPLWDTPNTWRR